MQDVLNYLKNAYQQARLVVFVGAGISKNSNLPTWDDFIHDMARKININSNVLTKTDYLKIPEIFWETDPHGYLKFIKDNFAKGAKTNPLDNLIVKLQPDHIITTNYDDLLEQSFQQVMPHQKYLLVYDDKSFMKKCEYGNHYLLKMHGDVNHFNDLILRESDYLNYEYTHTAISTFMTSLLMTHVFLFLGYSLRDINLSLIINKINNIKRRLGLMNKHETKNVLLYYPTPHEIYSYQQEQVYFHHKNIELVNIKDLPKPHKQILKSPIGNKIYAFLEALK